MFDQDQTFISRDALKEDARYVLAETDPLLAEGAKRPIQYPPAQPGSALLGLGERHMPPHEEIEREVPKMTPEQEAELFKRIDAMQKARPIE